MLLHHGVFFASDQNLAVGLVSAFLTKTIQKASFITFAQFVGFTVLCDPSCLQLGQEGLSRHFKFLGKFADCFASHKYFYSFAPFTSIPQRVLFCCRWASFRGKRGEILIGTPSTLFQLSPKPARGRLDYSDERR